VSLPVPAFSTSTDPIKPDIEEGMGDARDKALDDEARQGMTVLPPAGESASETKAGEDVDDSIKRARENLAASQAKEVATPLRDPLGAIAAWKPTE